MNANKLLAIFCAAMIALILSCPLQSAFAAEPVEAHFYIRYDSTTPNEDKPNESQLQQYYFPIGETAPDWVPGSDTDRYSPDGKVLTDTANVPGAEGIISSGHVNLYHNFNVDELTIKKYFSAVYDNIVEVPNTQAVYNAVNRFMGEEWAQAYKDNKVDVLWYVIKRGQDKIIHVDGVLYYTATGEIVDKNDPSPIQPDTEPTPVPDPIDPDFERDNKIDQGFLIDEDKPQESIQENNKTTEDAIYNTPKIENEEQISEANDTQPVTFPQTNDDTFNVIPLLVMCIICLIVGAKIKF